MTKLLGTTAEQFNAIKANAKIELAGIKLVIKRRNTGAIDIYCRVSKDFNANRWTKEDADTIRDFIVLNDMVDCNGHIPSLSTVCYEGLYYVA